MILNKGQFTLTFEFECDENSEIYRNGMKEYLERVSLINENEYVEIISLTKDVDGFLNVSFNILLKENK